MPPAKAATLTEVTLHVHNPAFHPRDPARDPDAVRAIDAAQDALRARTLRAARPGSHRAALVPRGLLRPPHRGRGRLARGSPHSPPRAPGALPRPQDARA